MEQKPKSWDNLAMKAFGGYGFGYGYVEKSHPKVRANVGSTEAIRAQYVDSAPPPMYASDGLANNRNASDAIILNPTHHSMPRKSVSGRYSLLNIENYAPPPSQFVQELTATATAFAKSTDNLIGSGNVSNTSINSCDCNASSNVAASKLHATHHTIQSNECIGYYSNLPKSTTSVARILPHSMKPNDSKSAENLSTVSEITRL